MKKQFSSVIIIKEIKTDVKSSFFIRRYNMKTLKIGIVGLGGMGNVHMQAYKTMKNVEVFALCDIVAEKMDKAVEAYGFTSAKKYEKFSDLIADANVDAVDIATPNYLHSVIAIEALNAGKHVFSEKPDCMYAEQCEEMKAAAEKSGKTLMVMRNNRYYEPSVFLKDYINAGKMGEIYSGRCGWQRRRGIPGKGGWFTTKAQSGGGPLIDLGVHMIDLAIWLMGNPRAVAVSGCTFCKFANDTAESDSVHSQFGEAVENGTFDVEDLAMGFIKFENGACLQIEFSWASNIESENRFVELRGEKAGCKWWNGESAHIYTEEEGHAKDIHLTYSPCKNGHAANLEHFVDVVLNGTTPDFVPAQGVNMIKILNAMYESAKTGKEVRLD